MICDKYRGKNTGRQSVNGVLGCDAGSLAGGHNILEEYVASIIRAILETY
jgi:hypothetical protein